jgi:hypothetical protein
MLGGKGGVTEGPLKMPVQYAAHPASTVAPHKPTTYASDPKFTANMRPKSKTHSVLQIMAHASLSWKNLV